MKVSTKLLLTIIVATASVSGVQASFFKRVAKFAGYSAVGTAAYYHPTLLGYMAQAKKEYTPGFASSFLEKRKAARYAALKEQYPHAKGTPAEIDSVTGRLSCKEMRTATKDVYNNVVNAVPQQVRTQADNGYNKATMFVKKQYEAAKKWIATLR